MPFLTQPFSIADRVDSVFLFIFVLAAVFLVGITAVMIYFVMRYSRRRNPTPVDVEGHAGLEIAWTLIPLVLFLLMFYYGWTNFQYMRNPPRDAMVIEVTGRQWSWSFKYPDGRQTDELYVALGRPVKLELHSADVLHGFAISAFRVKADVVPGRTNFLWFAPALLGTFDVQCTVMCGTHHTYMLSKVHVLPEDEFRAWYFGGGEAAAEAQPGAARAGEAAAAEAGPASGAEIPALALLRAKTCLACHTVDGAPGVGPTYKGLFGKKKTVVRDGREVEVTVDAGYLEKAIRAPGAEVVKGFPPAMPPLPVTDDELRQMIAYIETLR